MIQPIINDYKSIREKIFVLDPETDEFVPAAEWMKQENRERAEVVAIDTPYYRIAFRKKFVGVGNFKKAQQLAADVMIKEQQCRCPRRNESNYIYDARFNGLDELMEAIGGDNLGDARWWTCEKDSWCASRCSANNFWCFYGTYGYASNRYVYISGPVLPVVLLPVGEANSNV